VSRHGRGVRGVTRDLLDEGVIGAGAATREETNVAALLGELFCDHRADGTGTHH
jgi:hypothetical protein